MSVSVKILGSYWTAKPNENATKSRFEHVITWLRGTKGAVNCGQSIEKTLKIVAHILRSLGNKASYACDRWAGRISVTYNGLCIYRIPETVGKAFQTIFYPKPRLTSRDRVEALNTLADAGETIGYSGVFFANNPACMALAQVAGLTGTITDISMQKYDIEKAKTLLAAANEMDAPQDVMQPTKTMLQDKKKLAFLQNIKNVASLALTILGTVLLAIKGPALPAIALVSVGLMGLATTIVGICAHFFKESASYELPDFSKPPVLQLV